MASHIKLLMSFQVKANKEIEEKEKIILEKNIQLLEIEQQVEKLQVNEQDIVLQ